VITIDDFRKMELKVATIKEAQEHPNADRLYVLKVEVAGAEKQLVAGIRAAYTKEALIGKQVIVVDNLQPALVRGIESQGMILAASDEAGITVATFERPVVSGSTVK
jgi:methionine--tRNA ligase beta chain